MGKAVQDGGEDVLQRFLQGAVMKAASLLRIGENSTYLSDTFGIDSQLGTIAAYLPTDSHSAKAIPLSLVTLGQKHTIIVSLRIRRDILTQVSRKESVRVRRKADPGVSSLFHFVG